MQSRSLATALALCLCAGALQAAVSEEEAKQIGTTLTSFGAEKAGNKEGTIPPYTGGLTTPPPNYQPGSGWRPDPFPQDKPLFSINAKNMDKYADKLTDSTRELMRKYPDYRIDVYPTRRTVAYPKSVLDNSAKNATRCTTSEEGLALAQGCKGGIPFPIPKTGYEAMWNHMLNYTGIAREGQYQVWLVNAAGQPTMTTDAKAWIEYPYYDPEEKQVGAYYRFRVEQVAPARQAGILTMIWDHMNQVETGRRAWTYSPGQRRVRTAPDFAYDTPSDATGGALHFDMINLFTGKMDRFDFKLVGKKEVFMPYNNYKAVFETKPEDQMGPRFLKPEVLRWELHRVWVVEATLKPGKRHVFQKWTFYWDEDNAGYGMTDSWDAAGKLFKSQMSLNVQFYESLVPNAETTLIHDFATGVYALLSRPSPTSPGLTVSPKRKPSSFFTAEAMAGAGVR